MSATFQLPRPLQPFVAFATALRANGFAVAPEQTQDFIAAVELVGPTSIVAIHRSALATLAPPRDRRDEFDAVFRMIFLGQTLAAPADGEDDDDELRAFDDRDGSVEPPEAFETEDSGAEATASERLTIREFLPSAEDLALRQFQRRAARELPRRTSRRFVASSRGRRLDMRQALSEAVSRDGEVLQLPRLARRQRQRRMLLLVDVSGSMKGLTDAHMRLAHALMRSADRLEVFTLGTRLTRVTRALRLRHRDQALATASTLVADWDGGTRLGDALEAFLAVPRFAGFARGAFVIIVSDGLERGDSAAMISSVERLSRLAWSVLWLSPLATGPGFVPQTEALSASMPFIDRLGSGADMTTICNEILDHARQAA